jgi:hypothetical protein
MLQEHTPPMLWGGAINDIKDTMVMSTVAAASTCSSVNALTTHLIDSTPMNALTTHLIDSTPRAMYGREVTMFATLSELLWSQQPGPCKHALFASVHRTSLMKVALTEDVW